MRRLFMIAAAIILMGVSSCQENDDNEEINDTAVDNTADISSQNIMTFRADGESAPKTLQKTTYKYSGDDVEALVWQDTDDFSILPAGKSENIRFTIKSIDPDSPSSCELAGPQSEAEGYFALYPYTADAEYKDGKFQNISIPAMQTVSEGQYDPKADIMVAYSAASEKEFAFRHIGSKLGFKVPDDGVKTIEIRCSEPIAGLVEIALPASASEAPAVAIKEGSQTITLTCAGGFQKGKTYYACVLPTSESSIVSFRLFTSDSKAESKYYKARVAAMERAKRNTLAPSADKGHIMGGKALVTVSDLDKSTTMPSSRVTKIVFDYKINVDYSKMELVKDINSGDITCYHNGNEYYFLADKEICMTGSLSSMFGDREELLSIEFNNFNTDAVTSMYNMFYYCRRLTDLDLSKFNTENVESMEDMFSYCHALNNLNISGLNTAKVKSMSYMFQYCKNLENIDLSNLNTESVTTMSGMFSGCTRLKSANLSTINTDNVTSLAFIFEDCENLESVDFSGINTAKVRTMAGMFYGCKKIANVDLTNFNTQSVVNIGSMFNGCASLTSLDLSSFNTAIATEAWNVFQGCANLETIYVGSGFTINSKAYTTDMFDGCTKLRGNFGTKYDSGKTDKTYALIDKPTQKGYFTFKKPTEKVLVTLAELDKDKNFPSTATKIFFDYKSLVDVSSMTLISTLKDGDISCYQKGTEYYILSDKEICLSRSLAEMFYNYTNVTSISLFNFNVNEVINMSSIFYGCTELTSLNLLNLNKTNAQKMSSMFDNCRKINTLYLSLETEHTFDIGNMFHNCEALKTIYVTKDFNMELISKRTYSDAVFYGCWALVGGNGSTITKTPDGKLGWTRAHIDGGSSNPGFFTKLP